jgi:hypothetical protein
VFCIMRWKSVECLSGGNPTSDADAIDADLKQPFSGGVRSDPGEQFQSLDYGVVLGNFRRFPVVLRPGLRNASPPPF